MQKFFNQISNWVFKRGNLFPVIIISGWILFHHSIESLLSHVVVEPVSSTIQSNWYNDIIFGSIILLLLIFYIPKFRSYITSLHTQKILVACFVIFIYYRFVSSVWIFTAFHYCNWLKYADIFFAIVLLNLFLLVRKKNILKENPANAFLDDNPIGENDKDELGYAKYAGRVATKIMDSNFSHAFAIGVNGKWGYGKTSFFNLVRKKLSGDDLLIIDFNPWNSRSPQAIVKDFFDALQEKIKPYHSTISRQLVAYSNKLVELKDNSFSQAIRASVTAFTGVDSTASMNTEIDQALKEIGKKIIVFIDDIDRLDKDEIVEIMRLIRNTANFYNTFFIVAYDRNYVINALKDHNSHSYPKFLEKIFQIEINLPYYDKEILRTKLLEKLKQGLPESFYLIIETTILGTKTAAAIQINGWVESLRDVTRLANSICLNFGEILAEIDFRDLVYLELLRLKFPAVYELLYRDRAQFLGVKNNNGSEFRYALKKPDAEGNDTKTDKTALELFLNREHQRLHLSGADINLIIQLLEGIFPSSLSASYFQRSHLSITYPSKFDRYFAYSLLKGNLSEIDFSTARALTTKEFFYKINQWVKDGFASDLHNKFKEIKTYDSREDFEKVIRGIFYFGRLPSPSEGGVHLIQYDYKDLMDKLADYRNVIANSIYSNDGGREGLRHFILTVFSEAPSPYIFEASLIYTIISNYFKPDFFPISQDDLHAFSLHYLKTYAIQTSKINRTLFELFWRTERVEFTERSGTVYTSKYIPEEAKDVMKELFQEKNLNNFLRWAIEKEPFGKNAWAVSKTVVDIFDSWENFENWLKGQQIDVWEYLPEFLRFFEAFKNKKYDVYIPFDFKTIPVDTPIDFS
jgi:hypothetical protein